MPASFNGSFIFGYAVEISSPISPTADQQNAFFGISGIESLFGGQRGRITLAKGVLFGESPGDLLAVEQTFESYYDGIAYTLVDSFGRSFNNVKLESFVPKGRIRQTSAGGYFREYEARFVHMTVN